VGEPSITRHDIDAQRIRREVSDDAITGYLNQLFSDSLVGQVSPPRQEKDKPHPTVATVPLWCGGAPLRGFRRRASPPAPASDGDVPGGRRPWRAATTDTLRHTPVGSLTP
jgi:hypothetical protein